MIVGLTMLSLRSAVACDEDCDDDFRNTSFGTNANPASGGFDNTAVGFNALAPIPPWIPTANVAVGSGAMGFTGGQPSYNVAVGFFALHENEGNYNTALGYAAMGNSALNFGNVSSYNTAIGAEALLSNFGVDNTADGAFALFTNVTGSANVAIGRGALLTNSSGNNNTAMGYQALHLSTGTNNIAVGASAGSNLTTGSNNIDIGAVGTTGESNTVRLGKKGTQQAAYIQGISGKTVAGGVGVVIDTNGRLGTIVSSMRYKENIKPMDRASEAVLSLKPVTFRYKKELDPQAIPQFGLVAEDVAKVDPDLVARDEEGKPYTVRYEAVNAMLLNEFIKEHKKVQALEATVSQLREQAKEIADLKSSLAEQAETLRKVSARLEAGTPAARLAETR
jgi:hypothetical protein